MHVFETAAQNRSHRGQATFSEPHVWIHKGNVPANPLVSALQHVTLVARRTLGHRLQGIALCGSAALTTTPKVREIDILVISAGWLSQRIRGNFKGLELDVFVEGLLALRTDLDKRECSVRMNLLAGMRPFFDPYSLIPELQRSASNALAGKRVAVGSPDNNFFRMKDLFRKLESATNQVAHSRFLSVLLVEAAMASYFDRMGYWFEGPSRILDVAKKYDPKFYSLASAVLTIDATELRLEKARELVQYVMLGDVNEPRSTCGTPTWRHKTS